MPPAVARQAPILTVQYLRGLACLAVVVFHVLGGGSGTFYVGQAGVDVFFLISGFIMWTVTARREQAPWPFLRRRLARVVPLYWVVTLLVFARRYLLGKATLADLGYSLLFIPHVMSDGTTDPIIVPGWTLDFEMFFYGVFALCLWISVARRLQTATALLTALVIAGAVLGTRTLPWSVYTDPLLLEFVLGAWIGWLYAHAAFDRPGLGLALIACGTVALAVQQAEAVQLIDWRVLTFGLPAAAILLGALSLERVAPVSRSLEALGDASYAIYLVHVPIMSLLLKIDMSLKLRLVVVLALSVAVGWLFQGADTAAHRFVRRRTAVADSGGAGSRIVL